MIDHKDIDDFVEQTGKWVESGKLNPTSPIELGEFVSHLAAENGKLAYGRLSALHEDASFFGRASPGAEQAIKSCIERALFYNAVHAYLLGEIRERLVLKKSEASFTTGAEEYGTDITEALQRIRAYKKR